MGGKTTSTSAPRLNQIAVQTSSFGLPLTLGWGRGRAKCNLIWYGDFKAISHTTKTGGKGMGGSKNTTYTYTASIIMAIGEGPVSSVRTVYRDKAVLTGTTALSQAGLSLATGTATQAVWGYLQTKFPSEALNYSEIAYVYAQDYALSDDATLSNHSFEVDFPSQLSGSVCDADPAAILPDFLARTPGWESGLLGSLTDWSDHCRAHNLLLSPVLESQNSASATIEEWMAATNSAAFWSEGQLKVRPYTDAGATGNGKTWAPALTPAYALTENDFCPDSGDDPPVTANIVDQSDAYNIVQIEYLDRANAYNVAIAPAQDLANIIEFGARKQDPISLHCICDSGIAQKVAQLTLQRTLYVRETYEFRLPWNFVLLEPMDLVSLTTITDELDLVQQLVRIREIEEDEDGLLSFVCEGVEIGVASAALYSSHSGDGFQANTEVAPGSVSAPMLFIAPPELAGINPEVWLAAASTSPTWGGCEVWISPDGTNYSRVGVIQGPARYGTLTSALAAHDDPDNVNTLAVNLATSLGTLDGGSAAEMNAGLTLAIVDGEVVAYQNAALTSAYHYSLSPLRRGLRGTAPAAHASGAPFARLDEAIFKIGYDPSVVGGILHVKLPSFNIYGRALQDLASCTDYTISIGSAPGRTAYRDIKFKRIFSKPSTPTDADPSDWFDGVPEGTETLWTTTSTKDFAGALIEPWSEPQPLTGLSPRGSYLSSDTYYLNNVVTHGGGSYVAVQDNFINHAPSGTGQANAYWDVLAAPGDPGTPATPPSSFTATLSLVSGAAVNLRSVADANGYTGASDATITFKVPDTVTIRGLAGAGIGIDTGVWPTAEHAIALSLVIENGGIVDGGGGIGGMGNSGAGGTGGDAIFCRVALSGGITINSGGIVRGGGGGGGGGSRRKYGFGDGITSYGGGGGGGGFPNGPGGVGGVGLDSEGGDGTDGTTSGGGAGGFGGLNEGSQGGAGGNAGMAGTAGLPANNAGGPGGAAGYAVRKNGYAVSVINNGTMTGSAA